MDMKGNIPLFLEAVLQSQDGPLKRRGHGHHEPSWEERENKRMERTGNRGRWIESERRERTREWRERRTGEGG